ncbi:PEP-CTERM sorting domain-containing protein [Pseudoduganella umbonata]|uniref:PEP-CTERM sorting domain-containing protein n=1 Tax=Pseudoduganella umbonata TaxID=864828 RepID=A0A4P8HJU7_9BURK|nr:PEP-CTERM sorting domain-containing protein [Pseudoduganella umbonata]MBB3221677.1 hypothetical protein [Pseudoduganella umbonata]QCP09096.1 hypothetical protein FCL38_00575 [Pseudoduganella umbonata]
MKLFTAVFALALAAHPAPACAGASGSVTVGQLTYTLVDLDTADGIAPSLVFEPLPNPNPSDPSHLGFASVVYSMGFDTGHQEQAAVGTEPLELSYDLGSAGAVTGRLDGRAMPATQQLTVEASANYGTHGGVRTGAYMDTGYMGFTLSPRTRVEFSTIMHVQAGVTSGPALNEWFFGRGVMSLWFGDLPEPTAYYQDAAFAAATVDPLSGPRNVDESWTMTVAHDNTSLEGQLGTVTFNTSTTAQSVSFVPEPGALSMALAGLLVLGGARWRARSRRRV